jgi:hypothetical protein
MAQSGKGLTACPAESEAPETEINSHKKQQRIRKHLNQTNHGEPFCGIPWRVVKEKTWR